MSITSTRQNNDIFIRRYQPSDKDDVRKIFRKSMLSNSWNVFVAAARSPLIGMPLLSWTTLVGFLSRKSTMLRPYSLVATLSAALVPLGGIYYAMRHLSGRYIQMSLEDDLSKIEQVYSSQGCFLVAVDSKTNQIVGAVGGQDKDKGCFELRRMCVATDQHRRGIGQQLIHALHDILQPQKMFLSCTSIQYAAHKLYERAGYVLKKKFVPEQASWIFKVSIQIFYYEKEFQVAQ